MPLGQVKALFFDVFGTVVDWRSSIIAELETAYGISISHDEMLALTTMEAIVKFTERSRVVDQCDE